MDPRRFTACGSEAHDTVGLDPVPSYGRGRNESRTSLFRRREAIGSPPKRERSMKKIVGVLVLAACGCSSSGEDASVPARPTDPGLKTQSAVRGGGSGKSLVVFR